MESFTRQLGARSGIQLNQLQDNTERFVGTNSDQTFAAQGRFERGRIDKAIRVNRSNLFRMLGRPSSTLVSRLNEALVQIYDAFQNGAYEAVIWRLNTTGAVNSFMQASSSGTAGSVWTVTTTLASYVIGIKHLECFNEGVTAEIHADIALDTDGVTQIASKMVRVRLRDKSTAELLYEFYGSLDPAAKDEFQQSIYLPNMVSAQTDNVEITVAASATVPTSAAYYGKDGSGVDKWVSANLVYFAEGGTGYTNSDYDRCCAALKYGDHSFGYILGAGTRAVALISKLLALGKDINKQVRWDVPGDYGVSAAITFYKSLSIDNHYSHCFWAPLLSDDPINGGKDYIGTSCINVGKACARNARTDANGIAPKNFVIAGKDHPLARTGIVQKVTPTEQELDDLANCKINPVLFVRYTTGGRYVFVDSLTGALTNGDRKLIAVADMSSSVDDWVTQYGQECLQLPMLEAIKRMDEFLKTLFPALETAKWTKPSAQLDGKSFSYVVAPNNMRPNDRVDVSYWLHYDGTTRAIFVTQTLSK